MLCVYTDMLTSFREKTCLCCSKELFILEICTILALNILSSTADWGMATCWRRYGTTNTRCNGNCVLLVFTIFWTLPFACLTTALFPYSLQINTKWKKNRRNQKYCCTLQNVCNVVVPRVLHILRLHEFIAICTGKFWFSFVFVTAHSRFNTFRHLLRVLSDLHAHRVPHNHK